VDGTESHQRTKEGRKTTEIEKKKKRKKCGATETFNTIHTTTYT
jgi:hypothetical protein